MPFWIGVASSDHASAGVEGGFAQLGHGKHSTIKSLRKGDWIAYYSPSTKIDGGAKVQAFTSIGKVTSKESYKVEQSESLSPWRVDVAYEKNAVAAPIRPLLEELDLTRGKGSKWGMALRSSKVKATDADLRTIAKAMGAKID